MAKSISIFLSSLKMALATFLSRILGLVREQAMAAVFGASGLTDAFLVAYRIPNLLRDLFAEGAFSSAFVPTFIEENNISKERARNLLWSLFILLGLTTLFFTGVIFIFAEEIIALFAPKFLEDPEKFHFTVNLTKIMSPFLVFVSVAALFMGALNSLKVFFVPSLAPAFFNIVMICSIIFLPGIFISNGIPGIYSLGAGVFIGGLVQAFVQLPLIIKHGMGPKVPDNIVNEKSKKVVTLIGPGLIGFAATQINLLINTILASGTIIGAVSWLSYSFRLFQLPVGILSVSIGNSNLVHFTKAWKEGDKEKAKDLLSGSYFLSFVLVMPAMVILYSMADEIVNLIFERGQFSAVSTAMTAKALRWYAIGLPFYGIYKIFVPSFYAIDRQKIPVYTSIFSIIINIVFCVSLTPIYGFEILALGTSLSMFLNSTIQTIIIKSDIDLKWNAFFNLRFLKVVLSSAVAFLSFYFYGGYVNLPTGNIILKIISVGCGVVFIATSYFGVLLILGEHRVVRQVFKKILKK